MEQTAYSELAAYLGDPERSKLRLKKQPEKVVSPGKTEADLRKLFQEADQLAEDLLVRKARAAMRAHTSLIEFTIAMGTWFFNDRNGNYVDGEDRRPGIQRVAKFIDSWDSHFYLTGGPMRFTVDGPIVREW